MYFLLQESNAILANPAHKPFLQSIAKREKCSASFVGEITGNGKVGLHPLSFTRSYGQRVDNSVLIHMRAGLLMFGSR